MHACVKSIFVVFRNANWSYPILVSNRLGRKGWMDRRIYNKMMGEPMFISADHLANNQLVMALLRMCREQ